MNLLRTETTNSVKTTLKLLLALEPNYKRELQCDVGHDKLDLLVVKMLRCDKVDYLDIAAEWSITSS